MYSDTETHVERIVILDKSQVSRLHCRRHHRGVVLTSGLAIRPVDLGDLSASQDEQIVTARRLSNVDVLT